MSIAPRRQDYEARAAGVKRIHCIGDSALYSTGVAVEESVPVQLEEALHQQYADELFTCLNLGSEGWNIWNSLFHYDALFPEGDSDFMVLTVCNNDSEYLGCLGINYPGDKLPYWTDPWLNHMVDRGLKNFKERLTHHNIGGIVVFYQFWTDDKVAEELKTLCEKNGLPYLNVEQEVRKTYNLTVEAGTVSPSDGHASALFHKYATSFIAKEIHRLELLKTKKHQDNVIDRIKTATQAMLDTSYDPQLVFAWATRALHTKTLLLPRQVTDRTERQVLRDKLAKTAELLERSWHNWQKALWQEASISGFHMHSITEPGVWWHIRVHNNFLRLAESVRMAVWCQEDGKLAELEDRTRPLSPIGVIAKPEDMVPSLQKIIDDFTLVSQVFLPQEYEDQLNWPRPDGLSIGYKHFPLSWSTMAINTMNMVKEGIETLLKGKGEPPRADYIAFLQKEIRELGDFLAPLTRKIAEKTVQYTVPHPVLAVDAYITVRVANPNTERKVAASIGIKVESHLPAAMYLRRSEQMVDFSVPEKTYHVRLRMFVKANLRIVLRRDVSEEDFQRAGGSIRKVVFRPLLSNPNAEAFKEKEIVFDTPGLQHIVLEDFWLNV